MKSKQFKDKKQAKAFAASKHGFVEGPFIDEHCNNTYIVFYKERRSK